MISVHTKKLAEYSLDIGVLVDKVKVICWSGSRQGRIQDFDEIILAPPPSKFYVPLQQYNYMPKKF